MGIVTRSLLCNIEYYLILLLHTPACLLSNFLPSPGPPDNNYYYYYIRRYYNPNGDGYLDGLMGC